MSREIQIEQPRWLREFKRYLPLKNLFLLHGNVYDLFLYPTMYDGTYRWGYYPLRTLLHRFFSEQEYRAVVFYDSVDGLSFMSDDEQKNFESALRNTTTRASATGADSSAASNYNPEGSAQAPTSTEGRSRLNRMRDFEAALQRIRRALESSSLPLAVVIDHASRLVTSPKHLSSEERRQFINLLKCVQIAAMRGGGRNKNHVLVLVCDRLSDLPSWLYLYHPLAKPLQIDLPEEQERRYFFEINGEGFFVSENDTVGLPGDGAAHIQKAVDLTRGLSNYELECLRLVSTQEGIPLYKPKHLVERYKFGVVESAWDRLRQDEGRQKLSSAEKILSRRVKGQEAAVRAVVDIIKRAASGLSGIHHSASAHKPKGILFFAGPTGVGKTELAKALAELLFGDENACVRFDMSEYAQEHSDQRLLGAPPGYVGYEEGGQLTNKVKESPFSVLLFDEIEKAHPKLMDKFLQILEDGRMTDSKGETIYFSETVIIFTSNIGAYVDVPIGDGRTFVRRPNILPYSWYCTDCESYLVEEERPAGCRCGGKVLEQRETPYRLVKERILKALEEHFKQKLGRPEIYNRIGNNFVVFDYIRPPIIKQILEKMLENIRKELREKQSLELKLEEPVYDYLCDKASNNIQDGGRGIGNLVETALVNPLSRVVFDKQLEQTRLIIDKIIEKKMGEENIYELEWRKQ